MPPTAAPATTRAVPAAPAATTPDSPPDGRSRRLVDRLPTRYLDAVLLTLVLGVAVWVRVQLVLTGAPTFVTPDSDDYLRPAYELAHGLGFDPELRRTPLYSAFLALVLSFGGNLASVAVAQHVLGITTVVATYGLGRLTFGPLAGTLAALGIALSGPQLIYEHYLMTEALFTLVLATAVLVLVIALRQLSPGWLIAAGATTGLAALARPVGQVAIPAALGLPFLLALPRPRIGLGRAALVAAGLAVVLLPWMVRNLATHGTVGADGALGQALIGRTIRHDDGFRFDDPNRPDPDPTRAAARRIIQQEADGGEPSGGTITQRVRDELGLSQAQTSRLLRDLAIDAIMQRPGYYLAGTAEIAWELFQGKNERLLGHWRQRTTRNWDRRWEPPLVALLDRESPAEGPAYERADALTSFFQPWRWRRPITWLFAIGILFALVVPRYRPALGPALTAVLLVLAAAALDGLVWRFRYPADPLIAVVAAGGIAGGVALLAAAGRRLASAIRPA